MELGLLLALACLCGVCVVVKMLTLHARHRQVADLSVLLRDYQAGQRDLKAALHEENRVRAREQGLARTQARLLKQLGKVRREIDLLRDEEGALEREWRCEAALVKR